MRPISVEVFAGSELLSKKDRPLRLLPNGRLGVVFRGRAYPLQDQRRIDMLGEWFEKENCAIALERDLPNEFKRSSEPMRWHLDTTGFYNYLLVNSTGIALRILSERLLEVGIVVEKEGECTRPADDGELYDWFFRVTAPNRDLKTAVEEAVGTEGFQHADPGMAASRAPSDSASIGSETLRGFRSAPAGTSDDSIEMGAIAESPINAAPSERLISQASLESELMALRHRTRILEEERDHLRTIVRGSQYSTVEETAVAGRAIEDSAPSISTEAAASRDAVELAQRYADERDLLKEELEDRESLLVGREEKIQNLEAKLARAHRVASQRHDDLKTLFASLLPRTKFVRDSMERLLSLENLRSVATCIGQIRFQLERIRAPLFESARPWKEMRFSTGNADDGRLYFRHANGEITILVSSKADQRGDAEYLSRFSVS